MLRKEEQKSYFLSELGRCSSYACVQSRDQYHGVILLLVIAQLFTKDEPGLRTILEPLPVPPERSGGEDMHSNHDGPAQKASCLTSQKTLQPF